LNNIVFILSLLAAAIAAFLAYAAANYSHGPDIAIPIAGIAVFNAVVAFAAWVMRRWSSWVLWAAATMELFVVYYLVREAHFLGNLNGLDYAVITDLVFAVALLIKIALETHMGVRIWKAK
jgi:hypothetical protein